MFYDLQMEVEAAEDDQVSDFFSSRLNLKDMAVLTHKVEFVVFYSKCFTWPSLGFLVDGCKCVMKRIFAPINCQK